MTIGRNDVGIDVPALELQDKLMLVCLQGLGTDIIGLIELTIIKAGRYEELVSIEMIEVLLGGLEISIVEIYEGIAYIYHILMVWHDA